MNAEVLLLRSSVRIFEEGRPQQFRLRRPLVPVFGVNAAGVPFDTGFMIGETRDGETVVADSGGNIIKGMTAEKGVALLAALGCRVEISRGPSTNE